MLQRNARRTRLLAMAIVLIAAYTMLNLAPQKSCGIRQNVKTIHLATRWFFSRKEAADLQPELQSCSEKRCHFVDDIRCADAVAFHMWDLHPIFWFTSVSSEVRKRQLWLLFGQESEARTLWYVSDAHQQSFNHTMTYKRDSDLRIPYGRLKRLAEPSTDCNSNCNWTLRFTPQAKTAFLISSHCHHTHSRREQYVQELSRFMDVDVFGSCGRPCPDDGHCNLRVLSSQYKFYLAFENSRCADYITEKFWRNALEHQLVPVVLGGKSKLDYLRVVPEGSFIYTDDFASPRELALYLRALAKNYTAYAKYLEWTKHYAVDFIPDALNWVCRTCKLLHSTQARKQVAKRNASLSTFWNSRTNCNPSVPDSSTLFTFVSWHVRYFLGL